MHGLPLLVFLPFALFACGSRSGLPEPPVVLDVEAGVPEECGVPPGQAEVLAKLDPPFRKASVLLACGDDETSLVDPKTRAGLFGLAVARGFQGAADADRDLHVTADELYPLVRAQVQAAAAAQSARQTPLLQPRHD